MPTAPARPTLHAWQDLDRGDGRAGINLRAAAKRLSASQHHTAHAQHRGGVVVFTRSRRSTLTPRRSTSSPNSPGRRPVPRRLDGQALEAAPRSRDRAGLLIIGFPLAMLATYLLTRTPAGARGGRRVAAGRCTHPRCGTQCAHHAQPVVPKAVRRALNVESGLNDGLATPLVLLALTALADEEGATQPSVLSVGLIPVVEALIIAVVIGLVTAWFMDRSQRHQRTPWPGDRHAGAALFLFGLAEVVGANGFITAFVRGLTFGAASKTIEKEQETSELLGSPQT